MEILKVQTSIVSSSGEEEVLVYNKDRTIQHMGDVTKAIREIMKGEHKKFMFGEIIDKNINLQGEAPWQDW